MMLGIAVLAFVARAGFGLIYWHDKPLTHDEREYLTLAANIAAGRGFVHNLPEDEEITSPTVQQFGRAPLYPLFLAPLTLTSESLRQGRLPADVPTAVKIAQAVVGAIGVWFIGAIAWRAAGDARVGVAAAAIASVYPPLVWICAYALSEALFCTLALAVVWVLGRELDSPGATTLAPAHMSGTRVFAGGMLTGLAILTRPQMLFFVPLVAALAWRRRPRFAVLVVAGALLIVSPWTVRNALTYGRFVLVASEGGVTFWTGNHPTAQGEGDLAANPDLKQLNREFRARHANLTEEQLESIYYREALDFIAHDPIHWLGLEARKLFYTWVPIGPSYRLHSPLYFWLSVASYVLVLPFAIVGTIRLWRNGRRPWTLWLLACSALLVSLVFFPQERFRIPVIDPTLIVGAAALRSRSVSRSDSREIRI